MIGTKMVLQLEPIRPKSISEEIGNQIKESILDGFLKPGDKIPSERDMADELKVSRQCVREAINSLKAIGLLEVRKRSGIYVKSITSELLKGPFDIIKDDVSKVYELMDIRKVLEYYSAFYAAKNATKKDIKRLHSVLLKLEVTTRDVKKYDYNSEFQFHFLIAQASHNTMLLHIINTIYDKIMEAIKKTIDTMFLDRKNRRRLFEHHRAVFEAIKEGAAREAARKMVKHFEFAEGQMKKVIDNGKGKPGDIRMTNIPFADSRDFLDHLLR
jgi:GntR family transcriptional regulator, transcriptional repressor for pyruvate dehydrogenase complex